MSRFGSIANLVRRRHGRRWVILFVGLLLIATWQRMFARMPPSAFDPSHRVTASVGVQAEPKFFFFLYHLGLYPVAPISEPKLDSRVEAERLIQQDSKSLVQEIGLTFASGERGRVYLYFVDSFLRGNRIQPSLRPASTIFFTLSLMALFFSFWWLRQTRMGVLLVAFLGSNPFQLDAMHGQENVFSWTFITMIFLLALHAPLLGDFRAHTQQPMRLVIGIAIVTGFLMATVRQVRSEPMTMLAGVLMVYATLSRTPLRQKLVPIVLCLGVFTVASAAYRTRFEAKLIEARGEIEHHGGVGYHGPIEFHHEFWHPVWCGLGDFDTKYGYRWDDRAAYAYVLSIAEARAGKKLDLNPQFWAQNTSYDGSGVYRIPFPEAVPGYHEIVRDKVLHDIRHDPAWYGRILLSRVHRILTETTPVAIRIGDHSWSMQAAWLGPACVLLLIANLLARRWAEAKLLLFSTPMSLAALIVYSGRGMTSYAGYHHIGVALFVGLGLEGLAALRSRPARFDGERKPR
jgi:hypothetical protein